MFTLGIFTTHLPYIALAVFYAFFWIFGVNKASAGELQSGERILNFEPSVTESGEGIASDIPFDYKTLSDNGILPSADKERFSALLKIIHNGFYLSEFPPKSCYPAFFSRPPPFPF